MIDWQKFRFRRIDQRFYLSSKKEQRDSSRLTFDKNIKELLVLFNKKFEKRKRKRLINGFSMFSFILLIVSKLPRRRRVRFVNKHRKSDRLDVRQFSNPKYCYRRETNVAFLHAAKQILLENKTETIEINFICFSYARRSNFFYVCT